MTEMHSSCIPIQKCTHDRIVRESARKATRRRARTRPIYTLWRKTWQRRRAKTIARYFF